MTKPHRPIDNVDLELYAINTGSLYETHKALAARGDLHHWRTHVLDTVLPLYRKQIEPVTATRAVVNQVAADLKEYYERHLKEIEAQSKIADHVDGYDRDDLGESPDY